MALAGREGLGERRAIGSLARLDLSKLADEAPLAAVEIVGDGLALGRDSIAIDARRDAKFCPDCQEWMKNYSPPRKY
jgi:hypothetical protein